MSLNTHSKFFFGFDISLSNNAIDFDEGGGEIQASLTVKNYTLTEFAAEIATQMTAVGGQTYSAAVDRSTRKITISASSNFSLLITTGSRAGVSAYTEAGFTGADVSGTNSYESNGTAGSEYTTQFILQDHTPTSDNESSAFSSVNESANGSIEVISFGTRNLMTANFKYITNTAMPVNAPIRNKATGISDFRTFFTFLITKAPFEYMADEDTPGTFEKLILESAPGFRDGTGFRLRELVGRGLPGFYESGVLTFRKVS